MASFHTKTFTKHDCYMTPKYAWENINDFIPKDKVIWEPFMGDGTSGEYFRELGCQEVIHNDNDFFQSNEGEVIITNPPFSKKKEVFTRLKEIDKPFIVICPCSTMATQYFRKLFQDENIQIIIPRKRIHFLKQINGVVPEEQKNMCNFDCFYFCWKMNLDRDIIWLKNEGE
jgi:hypothetical protein